MFTGIIEDIAEVVNIVNDNKNIHFTFKSKITNELKVDQSVAHNGVCLTVVGLINDTYTVTAIHETLQKSNLKKLQIGSRVNLERAMVLGDRLDGHIVQGHVDQTAICRNIENKAGSWEFTFEYDPRYNNVTIEKGSITVNGVSLTVVDSLINSFSVAIIPYTFENTTFNLIEVNDEVNIEFDVLGKYVKRLLNL